MAKGIYIGASDLARKMKKGYIGIDGVARKIKKVYIGVNGVARLCWNGGKLAQYQGTAPLLSTSRSKLAATTVGGYALFGGGYEYSSKNNVDAYNSSLMRTTPTGLSVARSSLAATSVGNYALFGGGWTSTVDAYNSSLTRTLPTSLSFESGDLGATTIGNYAIFGGGNDANEEESTDAVNAYNSSLTRTIPASLTTARGRLDATSVGDYAIFGDGYNGLAGWGDAYNSSLTHIDYVSVPERQMYAAISVDNYALFGGGWDNRGSITDSVDVLNTSLTITGVLSLSLPVAGLDATSLGEYAIFAGGNDMQDAVHSVTAFDSSLSKTTWSMTSSRENLAAASIGDYAIFAGGSSSIVGVDVFTLV